MDCWSGVSAGRGATKPDNLSLIPRTYIVGGRHLLPKVAFWAPDVHGGPYTPVYIHVQGPYTPVYIHVQGHFRENEQDERGQDANGPEARILDMIQEMSETTVRLKSGVHAGEWGSMGWGG